MSSESRAVLASAIVALAPNLGKLPQSKLLPFLRDLAQSAHGGRRSQSDSDSDDDVSAQSRSAPNKSLIPKPLVGRRAYVVSEEMGFFVKTRPQDQVEYKKILSTVRALCRVHLDLERTYSSQSSANIQAVKREAAKKHTRLGQFQGSWPVDDLASQYLENHAAHRTKKRAGESASIVSGSTRKRRKTTMEALGDCPSAEVRALSRNETHLEGDVQVGRSAATSEQQTTAAQPLAVISEGPSRQEEASPAAPLEALASGVDTRVLTMTLDSADFLLLRSSCERLVQCQLLPVQAQTWYRLARKRCEQGKFHPWECSIISSFVGLYPADAGLFIEPIILCMITLLYNASLWPELEDLAALGYELSVRFPQALSRHRTDVLSATAAACHSINDKRSGAGYPDYRDLPNNTDVADEFEKEETEDKDIVSSLLRNIFMGDVALLPDRIWDSVYAPFSVLIGHANHRAWVGRLLDQLAQDFCYIWCRADHLRDYPEIPQISTYVISRLRSACSADEVAFDRSEIYRTADAFIPLLSSATMKASASPYTEYIDLAIDSLQANSHRRCCQAALFKMVFTLLVACVGSEQQDLLLRATPLILQNSAQSESLQWFNRCVENTGVDMGPCAKHFLDTAISCLQSSPTNRDAARAIRHIVSISTEGVSALHGDLTAHLDTNLPTSSLVDYFAPYPFTSVGNSDSPGRLMTTLGRVYLPLHDYLRQ